MADKPTQGLWVLPTELDASLDEDVAYEAAQTASYLLWSLSGRKFSGTYTVTERYLSYPISRDAQQTLVSVNSGLSEVDGPTEVRTRLILRGRPVVSIKSIKAIGGDEIAKSQYYLTDHTTIQFLRPIYDNLEIEYSYGTPPPIAGKMAAMELANQMAYGWVGSDKCSLPDRVTSVNRQGVSFTVLDPQDFIADLRTGVYAVDLFLKSVNPDGARRKAKIFSPDAPRGRRGVPTVQPSAPTPSTPNSGIAGGWIIVPTDQTGV